MVAPRMRRGEDGPIVRYRLGAGAPVLEARAFTVGDLVRFLKGLPSGAVLEDGLGRPIITARYSGTAGLNARVSLDSVREAAS